MKILNAVAGGLALGWFIKLFQVLIYVWAVVIHHPFVLIAHILILAILAVLVAANVVKIIHKESL